MEEIREIKISSEEYPPLLKKIQGAPEKLYIRGKVPKARFLAIVGTRRFSAYGKQVAFDIAYDLSQAGICIVSGMAKGIDTFAHRGALEGGSPTIAVLGTGIDKKSIYPKENLFLSQEIVKNKGALISEYPAGTLGWKQNFPKRNRIISGISEGVLVIEAPQKSGALITANWAKMQKRTIFALPGSIYSINSFGPNKLLKEGAIPVTSAQDILKNLGIESKPKQKNLIIEKNERKIVKVLEKGPAHIEKIIKESGLETSEVSALLSKMEIEKKIKNIEGNTYSSI